MPEIEGVEFTLYYDYDQTRDNKLSKLTPTGKLEWFQKRMEMLYYKPLSEIFDHKTPLWHELNTNGKAFTIAAFSILLNGIEALGYFMPIDKTINTEVWTRNKENYYAFRAFIKEYMKEWDANISVDIGKDKFTYIPEILWQYFRNGIAHSFLIEGGGLDENLGGKRWEVISSDNLEVWAEKFFEEFSVAINQYFTDMSSKYLSNFQTRFCIVYPC